MECKLGPNLRSRGGCCFFNFPAFGMTKLSRILLLSMVGACGLAQAGETEWPEFRGPTGQGISAATNVPVKWGAAEGVAWKIDLPGQGWSSPVLSQGKLYLTAAVPD